MRTLIVEDANNIRMALVSLLKKWGHDVVSARDGEEAWEMLQSDSITLVISDWMMPRMDGIELCRKIRETQFPRYVYFILLTSRSEMDDLVAGMEAGADDFLVKPCNKNELQVRVRAASRILDLQDELANKNERLETAYTTIRKDVEAAAEVQHEMLPKRSLRLDGAKFEWMFLPSTFVAGDIFNFFQLDDDHLGLYHLDVAGHGIPSALMSVMLSNVLRPDPGNDSLLLDRSESNGTRITQPDTLMIRLNERFQSSADSMLYFTMVYAALHVRTGHLQLCQAGHPNPVLMAKAAEPEFIGTGGFPVGMLPGLDYDVIELDLAPGDRLVLYSDGITECEDETDKQFGEEGLLQVLSDSRQEPMQHALDVLAVRLKRWKGDDQFSDDVSVLALERA